MDEDAHSYPPSVSSASIQSTRFGGESLVSASGSTLGVDLLTALRDGPPVSSNRAGLSIQVPSIDSSSLAARGQSPPMTSTSSSFQSEAPLFRRGESKGRLLASESSLGDLPLIEPDSLRRGSHATDTSIFNSEDNESRRSSLPNDWRASFTSDVSQALPILESVRNPNTATARNRPTASPPPVPSKFSPKMKPLTSPPLQPLNFKAKAPVGSPRSFSMAQSRTQSPNPALSSPQYFTRSLITVNPFASVRRRFINRGEADQQLLHELIAALEEYTLAFEAERPAFGVGSAQPMPARLIVPPDRLNQITDEIDSLVEEITEIVPEFRSALAAGGYGSLALSESQRTTLRTSADRFEAFEPTSDEWTSNTSWVQRLIKDLNDMTIGDVGLGSPMSPQSKTAAASPLMRTEAPVGLNSSPLIGANNSPTVEIGSQQMARTDSARSIELLNQGKKRWQNYVHLHSPTVA